MRGFRARMSLRGAMVVMAMSAMVLWLFATFSESREAARRSQCTNNLKSIGLALHNYESANGELPTGSISSTKVAPAKRLGWLFAIVYAMEQWRCFLLLDRDQPFDAPANIRPVQECSEEETGATTRQTVALYPIQHYRCPSNEARSAPGASAHSHFVGITGLGPDSASLPTSDRRAGVFGYDRHVKFDDMPDGLSNTMMVAETSHNTGPWTSASASLRAVDPARRPYIGRGRDFGGNHPGGTLVLLADGSVKFVKATIDPSVFEAVSTIAGGEILPGQEEIR